MSNPIARFFFLQKQTSRFHHTHITLYNYTFLTRRTILIYAITSDNKFYCVYQIHQLCVIFFFIGPIIVKVLKNVKYMTGFFFNQPTICFSPKVQETQLGHKGETFRLVIILFFSKIHPMLLLQNYMKLVLCLMNCKDRRI